MTKPPPAFIIYVITVLREMGAGRQLTAEALRLAKHGRRNPNPISRMAIWQSIIALTLGLEGGLVYCVKFSENATIEVCRALLACRGYRRKRFYVDETQEGGNREALLALAWLMSDTKMFELHWAKKLKEVEGYWQNSTPYGRWDHLGDAVNSEECSAGAEEVLCTEIGKEMFSLNDDGSAPPQSFRNGATNAILAAYGRLQGMLDESVELEAASAKLATYLERSETTAIESFLLSQPDTLARVLCKAQTVRRVLDDVSKGQLLEDQWWKWVGSVAHEIPSSCHAQLESKLPLLRAEFLAAAESFGGPSRICQPENMAGQKIREEVLLRNKQSLFSPTVCICGHPHCSNIPVAVPLISPPPSSPSPKTLQRKDEWEKCILSNCTSDALIAVRHLYNDDEFHVVIDDILACHGMDSEAQLIVNRNERTEKSNACLNVFYEEMLKHNLEVTSCVQKRNPVLSSSNSS